MPKPKNESVMQNIEKLVKEEHDLFNRKDLSDKDRARLEQVQVQLDQCWDLLRQRRALLNLEKILMRHTFARQESSRITKTSDPVSAPDPMTH